jgi:hypothetical protein
MRADLHKESVMNPEIAVQIFSDIAKISGTILSIFIAVIIFAVTDKDLMNIILKDKAAKVTVTLATIFWSLEVILSLVVMSRIDTAQPFDPYGLWGFILFFAIEIFLTLYVFFLLLHAKQRSLNVRAALRYRLGVVGDSLGTSRCWFLICFLVTEWVVLCSSVVCLL